MPIWPASLPQDQFLGLTEQDQDSVLRTQFDAGPPSRRQRFTAITRDVDVPIVLSNAERATFDTFLRTTLAGGALAFDWEDPVTDATVSFAFRRQPKWTLFGNRHWRTTLELEVQP